MDAKSLFTSTEVLSGFGLIAVGISAQALGIHDIFAVAMAPFGVGLILSDMLSKVARATRDRVKVRIPRDND
ncbi:hypothetical protein CCAX7_45280 [Capsulimonas corticalis]|uniref:Uncharacterized protein n=1 Tax=Capsulimonas corticalis TaxID=2219043 RepID=A0A402D6G0_9BACT|nr:hypothetical protein [Capsulimonas corticalis]BDI32477.1 hypothetical protein CCAX7_45280 [Capsulimonas corticalis]